MGLAEVMHVEFEIDVDAVGEDPGVRHDGLRLSARGHHARTERCGIEAVEHARLTVCTWSWRRSAITQPSAEVTPGKRGTTAHFKPISLISAPACSAPPPPNGMATNFAGS